MTIQSVLSITGMGVPPYSARGIKQTLTPIQGASNLRRTIDGTLINVSPEQFQKYKSVISCEDQQPPAIDGIWPGLIITVDCVYELARNVGDSPARPVVSGSERTEGDFVFYRPTIVFMINNFTNDCDELGASNSWQLELEEV